MADAGISQPGAGTTDADHGRLFLAVAIPIALITLAGTLEWLVNQSQATWPFDPAVFGWAVIVPLGLAPAVVAGFLWKPFSPRQTRLAALTLAALVSTAAAWAFWQWIGTPFDCGFGTVIASVQFLPQTIVVGLGVGGAFALSGLLATELTRASVRWWWVLAVSIGCEVVLLGFAGFMGFAALSGHVCYVPGPNYPGTP
jgi:hypothetical protein